MRIMGSAFAGVLVGAAIKIGGAGWLTALLVAGVAFAGVYALTGSKPVAPGKLPAGKPPMADVRLGEPVLQSGDAQEP